LWKKPEHVYIGDEIPKINPKQHYTFIENYQKSIFLALVERNLLTPKQCEECIEELEHQRKGQLNE